MGKVITTEELFQDGHYVKQTLYLVIGEETCKIYSVDTYKQPH